MSVEFTVVILHRCLWQIGTKEGVESVPRRPSGVATERSVASHYRTLSTAVFRSRMVPVALRALLLFSAATDLFGQAQRSEDERVADLKKSVIAALQVPAGSTVADVGCGDGFYTIPLARFLGPSGKVYAEDISDTDLYKLRQHLIEEGLKNVEVIKGVVDDPKLPIERLDAALIVNSYHEMTEHAAMLRHVRAALKTGGAFVLMEGIWDNLEAQSRDEQVKHHQLAARVAKAEVQQAGFDIVEVRDPFIERTPDKDGKSRWWVIVARKPMP